MNLTIDKEFQQLIPEHQGEEFEGLKKSILEEGCRDSLVVWNGIILDGHHRYQICIENGIPFKVAEKEFSSREDAKLWVINNQLGRRNLNDFQKSELVLVAKPLIAAKAAQSKSEKQGRPPKLSENSRTVSKSEPIHTDKELAKRAGVSDNTIRRVTTIKEKGTPEQIERARAGGKGNSINAVYTEIVHKDIEEKVCNCCGKKLPITEFYGGKNRCKPCTNRVRAGGGESQMQIIKEIEKASEHQRVDSKNNIIESTYDANDLEEELLATVRNFSKSLDLSITVHNDILLDDAAKKKFLSVLDIAESEIKKVKERLKS